MSGFPDLPDVRHAFVNAGGVRTHVALSGPEDAPPIMLVHGWPQNWWAWRHVIPALAGRFRVIAPDLRGHGWTERPRSGYEKERLASDLLALLDTLGIDRVSWIGHDWGGWVGFLAALRAPGRFSRMLALCVPHPWSAPHPAQLATMLSYQGPISLPFIGSRLAEPMVRTILQTGRGSDRLDATTLGVFADHIPAAVTVAMYRTFLTREILPIARGRYADAVLRVASTLIVGAGDPVTRGISAAHRQPQLQVQTLEGVGHWVPEQRPDVIIEWANR